MVVFPGRSGVFTELRLLLLQGRLERGQALTKGLLGLAIAFLSRKVRGDCFSQPLDTLTDGAEVQRGGAGLGKCLRQCVPNGIESTVEK